MYISCYVCITAGLEAAIGEQGWLIPEKRGRKPGSSLNGDRRVESMGGIAAGGWWGPRGRRGGAGMVRLCWVWPWGALGEKEGMCRKKERREEVLERSGRMKRA